jgi:hypothetical protein
MAPLLHCVDYQRNPVQARKPRMILPPRGTPVDAARRAELRKALQPEKVQARIEKLMAVDQMRLSCLFTDEDIHQLCDELEIEFRDRTFTPATALGLFVSQMLSRGDACSTVITQFNRERKRDGLWPVSEDGSAFCKARAKLPVKLIDCLNQRVVQLQRDKACSQWKWQGRDAYFVDGFVLRAPDTAKNQELYPQPAAQKEGLGFPQVRVVVTTSLATGCIEHYNTAPVVGKQTGEVSLFREKHGNFVPGDIVVGDSNFESFHDAVLLNRVGVDLVFCINGSRTSPFKDECLGIDDTIVSVEKPSFDASRFTREQWDSLPMSIQYRMIRYRNSGRSEATTIVTSLLDQRRFHAEDIANLYGFRWDIETDIDSFKSTMGAGELRCQTPSNVDREIAVAILALNLVRVLMSDAALVAEVHPREISFSRSRDAWRSFSDNLKTSNDLMWIILSTTSRFVRDRPGRQEPREIKRRNLTKYGKLKEPRPSRARRIQANATTVPPKYP